MLANGPRAGKAKPFAQPEPRVNIAEQVAMQGRAIVQGLLQSAPMDRPRQPEDLHARFVRLAGVEYDRKANQAFTTDDAKLDPLY